MKSVLWFALLVPVYLGFAGSFSLDEVVAGIAGAACVAVLSWLASRSHPVRFSLARWDIIRVCLGAVPTLVTDSARLLPRMLFGSDRPGTTSQEPLRTDAPREDPGWWAAQILATSVPPNSYVISRLSRPGDVIMHRLADQ